MFKRKGFHSDISIDKYVDRIVDDLTKRVEDSLKDAKERVSVASTSLDKRVDLLNELRGNVATTDALEALEKRVVALEREESGQRGQARGVSLTTGAIYGLVIALTALIGTIIVVADVLTR